MCGGFLLVTSHQEVVELIAEQQFIYSCFSEVQKRQTTSFSFFPRNHTFVSFSRACASARFCASGCRFVLRKVVTSSKEMMDLIFDWSGQCVENNSFMAGNALFTGFGEDGRL